MSAVDDILADKVEQLTKKNKSLEAQNEHLARLLSEALNVLQTFNDATKDKLRHYQTCRGMRGYDWKKLLNR